MSGSALPSVLVLLSTYNGRGYVSELMESVLNQKGVSVDILVRDDGSTDDTVSILEGFASKYDCITVLKGENLGVVNSFFELTKAANGHDYYAFADQDDVWKPDKLFSAVRRLKTVPASTPGLYYSRLEFVNEKLEHIGFSAIPTFSGFHNAVVQNQATGCTIVLNESACRLVQENLPKWALMHDWWCYLVVSAFGHTIYDVNTYIQYRKHGKNVTPATPFFVLELIARLRRYLGNGRITEKVTDQAREFKRVFDEKLDPVRLGLVDEFLEARNSPLIRRIKYVLITQRVRRNTRLDNFILKILIVLGRF